MPEQTKRKIKRKLDIWNKLAITVLTLFLVGCITVFFLLVNIINDPDGLRFDKSGFNTLTSTRIYDSNGELITEMGSAIHDDVTYDQIPQSVIDAFLSIEDSRYFEHNGFDLPRFISSALSNLRSGNLSQGGSTLTMQMIDNIFTKNKEQQIKEDQGSEPSAMQSIRLKIQEIYLALIAEQSMDKETIFEYYVNQIWFGSGGSTRGIQKAANYYFNKDVSQLTLGEAAFLAGCINAPYLYNPYNNLYSKEDEGDFLQRAQDRRDVTLQLMLNHGYITQEEYDLTVNTNLAFTLQQTESTSTDPNESYINQVLQECISLTGQDPAIVPMDIYTALNQDVQAQLDALCSGSIIPFPDEAFDTGISVVDNKSGEIIAVGAGRRYHSDPDKNDNSKDRKQPGSSMKPLLAYSPTFDILGWSTEHTVNDKAGDYFNTGTNLNNSDGKYNGKMSLAEAVGVSKNTPAAAAMNDLIKATGTDYWVEYCKNLGFDEDVYNAFNAQYSIGGSDMFASPNQMASAYSIFANGGKRIEEHMIRKVVRRADNKETTPNTEPVELISEDAAFMMSYILEKVVTGGYANFNYILKSDYPVYAKSGTSDWSTDGLQYGIPEGTYKDEWSLAYTSQYSVAVWTGYTAEYQKQGWYFTQAKLYQATAFHINKYVLDYCQKYGTYSEIPKTAGVSDYKNGYIKTEFLSKGDNVTTSDDDKKKACEAGGGTWDDETSTCTTKEDQEEKEKEEACTASGGTYTDGACTCPEGQELVDGACAVPEKSEEEKCVEQGGTWTNGACSFKSQAEINCTNGGGTWTNGACTYPTTTETGCIQAGGTWVNGACSFAPTPTPTPPSEGTEDSPQTESEAPVQ